MNRKLRSILCVVLVVVFIALCGWVLLQLNQAVPQPSDNNVEEGEIVNDIFKHTATGDLDAVITELNNGTDINIVNSLNNRTLLHYAIYYGNDKIAEYLVNNGINSDVVDIYGSTPLMLAVYSGNQKMYDLLKDSCNLAVQDTEGNTLLHFAAASGNVEIYNYLISRGLDLAVENRMEKGSIYYAGTQAMLENIMAHQGIEEISETMAQEMLFNTISADIIAYLLMNNLVDVNFTDQDGTNALVYAMYNGEIDVFEELIRRGIDVDHQDASGNTTLHCSAYDGYLEFAQILLSSNADKSIVNNEGYTAYEIATAMQNTEVAELLGGQ